MGFRKYGEDVQCFNALYFIDDIMDSNLQWKIPSKKINKLLKNRTPASSIKYPKTCLNE
jgi:hypothetical protein